MRVVVESPKSFTLRQVIGSASMFDDERRVNLDTGTAIKRIDADEIYILDNNNQTALLIKGSNEDRTVKVFSFSEIRKWVGFEKDRFTVIGESSLHLVEVI